MRRSSTSADCSPRTCVASTGLGVHPRPAPDVLIEQPRDARVGLLGVALSRGRERALDGRLALAAARARAPRCRRGARRRRCTSRADSSPAGASRPTARPAPPRRRPGERHFLVRLAGSFASAASELLESGDSARRGRRSVPRTTRPHPAGDLASFGAASDPAVRHRLGERDDAVARERPLAVERLVERDAERELIGARVDRLAAGTAPAPCTPACRRARRCGSGRPRRIRRRDGGAVSASTVVGRRRRSTAPLSSSVAPPDRRTRPKSTTFGTPFLSSRTLSGLKSRWTRPSACAAARPWPTSMNILTISRQGALLRRRASRAACRPPGAPSR